jgi:hypothetical protein
MLPEDSAANTRALAKAGAGLQPTPDLLLATCGAGVTSARRSATTIGGKYRASSKAGGASPSPADFESESVPHFWHRPGLRGLRGSGAVADGAARTRRSWPCRPRRAGLVESSPRCAYDNEGRSASAVASQPELGSSTPVAQCREDGRAGCSAIDGAVSPVAAGPVHRSGIVPRGGRDVGVGYRHSEPALARTHVTGHGGSAAAARGWESGRAPTRR